MFHWRWAARFLINAGVYTYGGFQGLGENVSVLWGLGPNVGMTLLPEGWTKIPLEFTFSYRFPLTLLIHATASPPKPFEEKHTG